MAVKAHLFRAGISGIPGFSGYAALNLDDIRDMEKPLRVSLEGAVKGWTGKESCDMKCITPDENRLKNRNYTPRDIDLCDWEQVRSLFRELGGRAVSSVSELERLILDISDLYSAVQEEAARCQLAIAVDTSDTAAQERFRHFNEKILAPASEKFSMLDEKILENPFAKDLDPRRYGQLIRLLQNKKELFRKKNVPLETKNANLAERYNAVSGSQKIEFQGQTMNFAQASKFLKDPDRSIRESAWRAIAEERLRWKDEINDIFDEMIKLRHETALNAGFENYRDFKHREYNRFDYTPEDCFRFHEIIEEVAVPIMRSRNEIRRKKLGVDSLRPWDMSVDMEGRPPLKPFDSEEALVAGCARILDAVYPRLGDTLRLLHRRGHLDLMTRQNKAPVGFNMPLDETRVSFIFMNATGRHDDMVVLLHESGHAVETAACAHEPIFLYRHTPQEWGECASQSMELLSLEHLDVVYDNSGDRRRCIAEKLENVIRSLIYTARIDAYQHWLYTHPEHTREQREKAWMNIAQRFSDGVDDTGLEQFRKIDWQGIPHLFIVPFYYIEYGIAQLAAIQVYRNAIRSGESALKPWLDTMRLGYSVSIPELYRRAGLDFRFHGDFAASLIRYIDQRLQNL